MAKSISISNKLADELDSKRGPGQSYDNYLSNLMGISVVVTKRLLVPDNPNYIALMALKVGESFLMPFERDEGYVEPINLRQLSHVLKRVKNTTGWRLGVQGSPRGQRVFRIA